MMKFANTSFKNDSVKKQYIEIIQQERNNESVEKEKKIFHQSDISCEPSSLNTLKYIQTAPKQTILARNTKKYDRPDITFHSI